MDMRETLSELGAPYCTKHNCQKVFNSNFIGGSWLCSECNRETGEAFKTVLTRLKQTKQQKENNNVN